MAEKHLLLTKDSKSCPSLLEDFERKSKERSVGVGLVNDGKGYMWEGTMLKLYGESIRILLEECDDLKSTLRFEREGHASVVQKLEERIAKLEVGQGISTSDPTSAPIKRKAVYVSLDSMSERMDVSDYDVKR